MDEADAKGCAPLIAGVVKGVPFRVEVDLPLPDRSELEELKRQAGDPRLTTGKQEAARQAFRVAEVLHGKADARLLAVRTAIPEICRRQKGFLLTGNPRRLVDVSLSEVAELADCRTHDLGLALEGYGIASPIGVVPMDNLLGMVGHGRLRLPVLDVDPRSLIPTDEDWEPAAYAGFVEIFKKSRQRILDPVLVVRDSVPEQRDYLVQGHHRAAAAFSVGTSIRVVVLSTKDHLAYIREGLVADLASVCSTFDEFVDRCRRRALRLGLLDSGWSGWFRQAPR